MMKIARWIPVLLLFLPAFVSGSLAQTFRRITNAGDIVPGLRYVLAAPVYNTDDAVYAVVRQEATGTGTKSRKAAVFNTDAKGQICADDTDIALFELEPSGTAYELRDVHNGGYLAYSNKKTTEQKTGLYTMTDEEIAAAPSSSGTFYKTFKLDFSLTKTCLKTAQKVQTGSGDKVFYLLPSYGLSDSFRLYQIEDMAGTLYLYRELVKPSLDNEASGDWTFCGDWSAEELSQQDYSQALRIDFTAVGLPADFGEVEMDARTMPGEYVWTYVRTGEGVCLPKGWPNVIEVDPSEPSVYGRAVTPVKGGDACVMAPKYPFYASKEYGISWYRTLPDDGGWLTVGLPFAVQTLTKDTPEGETVGIERRAFEEVSGAGVVFRKVEDGDGWEAGTPYLWKPVQPAVGTVCFHAEDVPVMTGESVVPDGNGFYTAFMAKEIDDAETRIYLLDNRGESFVRAAQGSRITTGRGYLFLPDGAGKSVRTIVWDGASDCATVENAPGNPVPVYTPGGVKVGMWQPGSPLPSSWPRGVYVMPYGTFFKP